MFDVGRDLPAESAGILLAEVDLVLQAAYPEPQRLHCWASIKVVFEFYSDPLRHRGLHDCMGYLHRTRSTVIPCSPRRRRPPETMPARRRAGTALGSWDAAAWRPWADSGPPLAAGPGRCLTSARVIRSVRAGL